MGNSKSSGKKKLTNENEPPKFESFGNKYESIEEVQQALMKSGLESSNLIVGIDFTISNESQGKKTFFGKNLHSIDPNFLNPYQTVISVIGRTLSPFDDDNKIAAFGFGDSISTSKSAFPFYKDRYCEGFEEVLTRYTELVPTLKMAGPTSFAPLIQSAIQIVKNSQNSYHILIIICDGEITPDTEWLTCMNETKRAIVHASTCALSIIVVGVGDGPWNSMEEFDDALEERKFDNFNFVEFHKVVTSGPQEYADVNFSLAALQEIPSQYHAIKKLGLLGKKY